MKILYFFYFCGPFLLSSNSNYAEPDTDPDLQPWQSSYFWWAHQELQERGQLTYNALHVGGEGNTLHCHHGFLPQKRLQKKNGT
jgi:hypothetical protein